MILAASSSTAGSAIDPTAQILLTVFGAALVTAGATFALAWWQARRDNKRWVRERRHDAYLKVLELLEDLRAFAQSTTAERAALADGEDRSAESRAAGAARLEEIEQAKRAASAKIALVGSLPVVHAWARALSAAASLETSERADARFNEALTNLHLAMHKALDVNAHR